MTTHYVDVNGTNPVSPYTNWVTAATNIQDAINVTAFQNVVLVTNGIYQYGGASFSGSNRVHVINGVSLQSVNGPAVTIIKGYQVPGTTNGANAMRCVYLTEFSTLSGFTLTSGATQISGSGGGVVAETLCVISNCVITGNASAGNGAGSESANNSVLVNCIISGNLALNGGAGGGAYGNTLVNCIISNNVAVNGGGVANCTVFDSLLTGNGSTNNVNGNSGGAAYFSTLNNCTLAGNFSHSLGAADGCTLNNSIIFYNVNGIYADCYMCRLTNCCTTLGLGNSTIPNNSISNAPGFINLGGGDFHLTPWSRCIDAGNSALVTNNMDLDGNPRIVGAAVDMGAYENQSPFSGVAHYVSLTGTNPIAPYTNWLTAATNIPDAVALAQVGELVIAGDGVYTLGGTAVYGTETNRVALTNAITLVSAGGLQAAAIAGGFRTRCVYVGSGAVLMGFTLTNGNGTSVFSGDITNEQSGGGAWCASGGVVSNCLVVRNSASPSYGLGGGILGGTIWN
ncbi:MAG: choice-of-anchor Q domain-containing protein, partial [Limisphaerales bacterium]